MKEKGVFLFHTTSAAMRSEKILSKAGLTVKLIPTPREFSSDCGIAIRFDWHRAEDAETLLEEAGVEMAGMHALP